MLWHAHAEGRLTDADAEAISEADIAARRLAESARPSRRGRLHPRSPRPPSGRRCPGVQRRQRAPAPRATIYNEAASAYDGLRDIEMQFGVAK